MPSLHQALKLRDLDRDISKSAAVQVGTSLLNDIVVINIVNRESVGLATPGAVPIDMADLHIAIIKIQVTLRSRGGVRPSTRGNASRFVRSNDNLLNLIGRDLVILVVVLEELSPCIWIKRLASF